MAITIPLYRLQDMVGYRRAERKTRMSAWPLPHVGSATTETRDAMGFRALDNLDAFFAGREPGDRVA